MDLEGFKVHERDSWDNEHASPEKEGFASVQEGHISGTLRLEGYVFAEYSLNFKSKGDKKELKSDVEAISDDDIRAIISGES